MALFNFPNSLLLSSSACACRFYQMVFATVYVGVLIIISNLVAVNSLKRFEIIHSRRVEYQAFYYTIVFQCQVAFSIHLLYHAYYCFEIEYRISTNSFLPWIVVTEKNVSCRWICKYCDNYLKFCTFLLCIGRNY